MLPDHLLFDFADVPRSRWSALPPYPHDGDGRQLLDWGVSRPTERVAAVGRAVAHKSRWYSDRCGQLADRRTTMRRELTCTSAATLMNSNRQVRGCPSPSGSRCRRCRKWRLRSFPVIASTGRGDAAALPRSLLGRQGTVAVGRSLSRERSRRVTVGRCPQRNGLRRVTVGRCPKREWPRRGAAGRCPQRNGLHRVTAGQRHHRTGLRSVVAGRRHHRRQPRIIAAERYHCWDWQCKEATQSHQ